MKSRNFLIASGVILSAVFIATAALAQEAKFFSTPSGGQVDIQSMRPTDSTPLDHAQTEGLNEHVANSVDQSTAQINNSDAQYQALEQQYKKQLQQNRLAQQDYQNLKNAYHDATHEAAPSRERVTVNAPAAFKPFDMEQCPDNDKGYCQRATCVPYPTRDGVIDICQSHGTSFP